MRGSKLLWVDIDRRDDTRIEDVAEAFDLDDATKERLASSQGKAVFNDAGRYLHVTTYSPCEEDRGELIALECVVGENWVVTAHDRPLEVLEEFAERVSGSGDTGELDGPPAKGAARPVGKPGSEERGVLSRPLYTFLKPVYETGRTPVANQAVLDAYAVAVRGLFEDVPLLAFDDDGKPQPITLRLDPAAELTFEHYEAEIAVEARPWHLGRG